MDQELQSLGGSVWKGNQFYQGIFLQILGGMNQGCLKLTLPNGDHYVFGSGGISPESGLTADLTIRSKKFFKRCLLAGGRGLGESYVAGEWESSSLVDLIHWFIVNHQTQPARLGSGLVRFVRSWVEGYHRLRYGSRYHTREKSFQNSAAHYDLGNDFFKIFLAPSWTYSAADYSTGAKTLEEAQKAKFFRLAQGLQIQPTDHVLEIGGGWGAFAIYLATEYGCRVTTLTLSDPQLQWMLQEVERLGLTRVIHPQLMDYRDVQGNFDKVVSVEMLEAVGSEELGDFFQSVSRVLKPKGLLGLQTINCADSRYKTSQRRLDWIQKYIFPGSWIHSISSIVKAAVDSSEFQLQGLYDLGSSYAKTLEEWHQRFWEQRDRVKTLGFDEAFIRKWSFYLCYCQAAFEARYITAVQMIYTRPNNGDLKRSF